MNWDIAQLSLAIISAWLGAGLCAGGLAFASMQKEGAFSAVQNYREHVRAAFVPGIIFGPFALILAVILVTLGKRKYDGMSFPGAAALEKARHLEDEVRAGES